MTRATQTENKPGSCILHILKATQQHCRKPMKHAAFPWSKRVSSSVATNVWRPVEETSWRTVLRCRSMAEQRGKTTSIWRRKKGKCQGHRRRSVRRQSARRVTSDRREVYCYFEQSNAKVVQFYQHSAVDDWRSSIAADVSDATGDSCCQSVDVDGTAPTVDLSIVGVQMTCELVALQWVTDCWSVV